MYVISQTSAKISTYKLQQANSCIILVVFLCYKWLGVEECYNPPFLTVAANKCSIAIPNMHSVTSCF